MIPKRCCLLAPKEYIGAILYTKSACLLGLFPRLSPPSISDLVYVTEPLMLKSPNPKADSTSKPKALKGFPTVLFNSLLIPSSVLLTKPVTFKTPLSNLFFKPTSN